MNFVFTKINLKYLCTYSNLKLHQLFSHYNLVSCSNQQLMIKSLLNVSILWLLIMSQDMLLWNAKKDQNRTNSLPVNKRCVKKAERIGKKRQEIVFPQTWDVACRALGSVNSAVSPNYLLVGNKKLRAPKKLAHD